MSVKGSGNSGRDEAVLLQTPLEQRTKTESTDGRRDDDVDSHGAW